MLKVYTIGDINPIGKPRAYFAARKEDYGYLNSVTGALFQASNVAVYYDDEQDTRNTSQEELLSMNVIVLLLTSETLAAPTDVMNRIFLLAAKNAIPLLILGMDDNVGTRLNAFCEQNHLGNRHVIFPNAQGIGEHSFHAKLKAFLSSNMFEDQKLSELYEHFDANVFLSYRKQDKPLAAEVIRLINSASECRGYALWYDEYLTVGENYDNEIRQYVEVSDVFLLLLTDKMLEKGSYALEQEYARALQDRKKIVLINALTRLDDISLLPKGLESASKLAIIPLRAIDELPELLFELLGGRTFSSKAEEASHYYYLGMAYLKGISKERDEKIATGLFQNAILLGNMEACDAMIGICMERGDVKAAITYQERLTEHYRTTFELSPTFDSYDAYLTALGTLGEYHGMNQDYVKMQHCYEAVSSSLSRMEGWEKDKRILEHAIICYDKLGSFASLQIDYSEDPQKWIDLAKQYYDLSFEFAKQFAQCEESLMARRFLYTPMMRIADLANEWSGQPPEYGLKSYEAVLPLIQEADALYPCFDTRCDLYGCYKSLAELANETGMDSEVEYAMKCLEYARQTYLESKSLDRCEKYALAMEDMAKLQYQLGEVAEAIRNLNKATKARHTIKESYDRSGLQSKDNIRRWFYDYVNVSQIQFDLQNFSEAFPAITMADQLMREHQEILADETGLKSLAEAHLTFGAAESLLRRDASREELRKALDYYKFLYENYGRQEYQNAYLNIMARLVED